VRRSPVARLRPHASDPLDDHRGSPVLPDGSSGYVTDLHDGTVRVLDLDG
jgi:hypothetical protein